MNENNRPRKVVLSPLWRFRKQYCNECSHKDACSSDKTLEAHCIEALIALSPTRLIEKTILSNTHL